MPSQREAAISALHAHLREEAEHNLPVSPDTVLFTASIGADGGILFFTSPLTRSGEGVLLDFPSGTLVFSVDSFGPPLLHGG